VTDGGMPSRKRADSPARLGGHSVRRVVCKLGPTLFSAPGALALDALRPAGAGREAQLEDERLHRTTLQARSVVQSGGLYAQLDGETKAYLRRIVDAAQRRGSVTSGVGGTMVPCPSCDVRIVSRSVRSR
jgi:hypothetical protein